MSEKIHLEDGDPRKERHCVADRQQYQVVKSVRNCRGSHMHQNTRLGLPQWCDQQFKKKTRSILFFVVLDTSLCNAWQANAFRVSFWVGAPQMSHTPQLHNRETHITQIN